MPTLRAQATVTDTIASGTQRYKFFKRPIMPKVAAVPPQVLLAPTAQGENNPLEPYAKVAESLTKDAEIQTAFRESEAQTTPYAPQFTIPAGQNPEILLLQDLRYEDGLPLGEKEMTMIEYARAKQDMEINLPPFTDEASLVLRKKLMEQQEMREFHLRELEIDANRQERVEKIKLALTEREESNDFMTSQRLESVRLLRMEEREKVLQKIRNKRIKALRRIAHQRNGADPVLSEGTAKDIIDGYFDRGSTIYAPIKREGKEIMSNQGKFDVTKRTEPLDKMANILHLEATIPQSLMSDNDSLNQPPIFGKSVPVGAGHRVRGNTIKAAEPRLTSAAQRTIRMTKRDVEEMHQILQERKRTASPVHQQQQGLHGTSHGSRSPTRSPTSSPLRTMGKKTKGRPASPDLTHGRDLIDPAVENYDPLSNDHDFQLAVGLLQRLIRGRAVQNIMFEGKYRRRELISELKSADIVEAKMRDASDAEIVQMEKNAREERLRETSLEAVAGVVSANLVSTFADEKARVDMITAMQLQATLAVRERRTLEAAEAGRRQKQGMEIKEPSPEEA